MTACQTGGLPVLSQTETGISLWKSSSIMIHFSISTSVAPIETLIKKVRRCRNQGKNYAVLKKRSERDMFDDKEDSYGKLRNIPIGVVERGWHESPVQDS